MKNDTYVRGSGKISANLYPHLKITDENFPRILATRKIDNDRADYFGAFLPKTAVRILIDFLSRTFRLRSCDIPIDGTFDVPCTQFYERRCLGPCVESLCGREDYLQMVLLVKLFLDNNRGDLLQKLYQKIDEASESLDFEGAAFWRDIVVAVEKFWAKARWQVWLDDAVDTYAIDRKDKDFEVFLVTQRGRRTLGRKVFHFERSKTEGILHRIIESFYQFHLPKEIRVLEDFQGKVELVEKLSKRFSRKAKIMVVDPEDRRLNTAFALTEALSESEIDAARPQPRPQEIAAQLKRELGLSKKPDRIFAFDVAHISARGFVAAQSVSLGAKLKRDEYAFELSGETGEPKVLGGAIRKSLRGKVLPDLILVDGGRSQLAAAVSVVRGSCFDIPVAAAVKPRGKHSEISHFILENGVQIDFDPSSTAQNLLKRLRDEAHDLANRVHRDLRDMGHHYELASMLPSINEAQRRKLLSAAGSLRMIREVNEIGLRNIFGPATITLILADLERFRSGTAKVVLPLIVPLRYSAEGGGAEDLRPIARER